MPLPTPFSLLTSAAQAGTRRVPVARLAEQPGAAHPLLQRALAQLGAPDALRLLRASAALSVLERSQWRPQISHKPPPAPAPESRPAPQDAGVIAAMRALLTRPEVPGPLGARLLRSLWHAGQRLPHSLLLAVLPQAGRSNGLRIHMALVLGARGHWLVRQGHARWKGAASACMAPELDWLHDESAADAFWHQGSTQQRLALLRHERRQNPERARARLDRGFADMAGARRAVLLAALGTSLSMADEPFLEQCLQGRERSVRQDAALLLRALPQSRRSQRMQAAVRALLSQDGSDCHIAAPEAFEAAWAHDGVQREFVHHWDMHYAAHGSGNAERSWWLQQLVASTPLDFWTQTLGLPVQKLRRWWQQQSPNWQDALILGWMQAAVAAVFSGQALPEDWMEAVIRPRKMDSRLDFAIREWLPLADAAQCDALWLLQIGQRGMPGPHALEKTLERSGACPSPEVSRHLLEVLSGSPHLHTVFGSGHGQSWGSQADKLRRHMLELLPLLHSDVLGPFLEQCRDMAAGGAAVQGEPDAWWAGQQQELEQTLAWCQLLLQCERALASGNAARMPAPASGFFRGLPAQPQEHP